MNDRMNRIKIGKKAAFLLILMIFAAVFTLLYLGFYGNKPQIFTDIVIEYTAMLLLNKPPECTLIFFLCAAGVIFYTLFFVKQKKSGDAPPKTTEPAFYGLCAAAIVSVISLVLYGKINFAALLFLAVGISAYLIKKEFLKYGILLPVFVLYAVFGIYRVYALFGGGYIFNTNKGVTVSLVVSLALIIAARFLKNGEKVLKYACLVMQIFIPLLLLLFFNEKYLYNGEIITLSVPLRAKTAVGAAAALFICEAVIRLLRAEKGRYIINFGTCVSIMAYNSYIGLGAIMPPDLHHSFENVSAYFQIFEQGQIPFKEYMPVSGLYSVIEGAWFRFFGGGIFANYNISQNLFYLFIIALTLFMLKKRFDETSLLLYSLIYVVPNYNRFIFILPIMLWLSDENLIKKPDVWLKVWFLTSLFHGLYYPLVGAAVCAAFMPLGLYIAYNYAKNGSLKVDIKKISFWVKWALCLLPAVLCIKLLFGTYLHIKAMGGQTVYADGLTFFGRLPEGLMPYINTYGIKIAVSYILSFVVPAAAVWTGFAAALKFGGVFIENKKPVINNAVGLLCGISTVIMPLVAYTSTFVRGEGIFGRSGGIMYAAAVMLAVLTAKYVKNTTLRLAAFAFMVFIPACTADIGYNDNDAKLSPFYYVNEGYEYIKRDNCPLLGEGFIKSDIVSLLDNALEKAETLDNSKKYYALFDTFGEYCLSETKAVGMIEKSNVKGYETAKETVKILRENKPVVGTLLNTYEHYYMNHWLLTSGEYVYSEKDKMFHPNTNMPAEEVRHINEAFSAGERTYSFDSVAAALGMSMPSLAENCFEQKNIQFGVYAYGGGKMIETEDIYGDTADFLYIRFADTDKKYVYSFYNDPYTQYANINGISKYLYKKYENKDKTAAFLWIDEDGSQHIYNCAFAGGELLIPLGLDAKWLFGTHNAVYTEVFENGVSVPTEIEDIKFLKLREVK